LAETRVASISFTIAIPVPQGTLTVDTGEVKGEVSVDGVVWGIAPQSRSIDVGMHVISFENKAGYKPIPDVAVSVVEGEEAVVVREYVVDEGFKIEPWMIIGGAGIAAIAIVAVAGRKKS